jgi:hypothetical protein
VSELHLAHRLQDALLERGVKLQHVDDLATSLLWRIGRLEEGPVTVGVGFATSVPVFADLPRMRSVTDDELVAAIDDGSLRVEWVGPRGR